jgi:hypothetical protein
MPAERYPRIARRAVGPATLRGATLAEFVVVVPTLLLMIMATLQAAFVFHAKSQLNYATVEAARAGSVSNASLAAMSGAFARAMTGYYGGGQTQGELARSLARAGADLSAANLRIEVLSPTRESFDDFHSPALAARMRLGNARVLPNDDLGHLRCPRDVSGCNGDPATNRSGQTLADANLLKIRVTYGIPRDKQMPMAGRFYTWAVRRMNPADPDPFRRALLDDARIPLVAHTTIRMMSPPIENNNGSNPGPGNNGRPSDPGRPPAGEPLPACPWWDPSCLSCPEGSTADRCRPDFCPGG